MKKLQEQETISSGNATSLMVFIELGYVLEKQRGTLSVAFPDLGNRGLFRLLRKLATNPLYTKNKEELLGISERFFNNTSLRSLYKTLAFLDKSEKNDKRTHDINLVLSKIEKMINSKLTNQEKNLFSSFDSSIEKYSNQLDSLLASSAEISPENEPESEETPSPEEKPAPDTTSSPEEKPAPEKVSQTTKSSNNSLTNEPSEEDKREEEPKEKPKTEEQFKSLIKRLVKETLRDYEKKFGKL